jgi:hypothetical protein
MPSNDEVRMRELFSRLLKNHSVFAARARHSRAPLAARFFSLLEQFREHRARADRLELAQAIDVHKHVTDLLAGYLKSVEIYRQRQESVAEDFNIFEVMQLTGKEVRHSMVLTWLLDRSLGKFGTHAQGNLGFRLFLNEFGLPAKYADANYWVRREVASDESIVDVEVACRGQFIIHIENKIWSSEGTDQTDREWRDLQRRAQDLELGDNQVYALFLSPHGTKPANVNFRPIPWGRIVHILEKFAELAKPFDVKLFAQHYARTLRRFIAGQDFVENRHAQTIDE